MQISAPESPSENYRAQSNLLLGSNPMGVVGDGLQTNTQIVWTDSAMFFWRSHFRLGARAMNDQPIIDTRPVERFITIREAAAQIGVHKWKLNRAVNQGLVPSYRFCNKRRLVRVSEVLATIEKSRTATGPIAKVSG